jgi:RNA ligase
MLHPARTLAFDDLHAALEERVASGALARSDEPPLALYVYTNRCVYEGLWDYITVLARGLVLDLEARAVRATPFPKFFNHGERGSAWPEEPFEVYEKIDGSLGIVFHDGTRWRVVTKGAFQSAQARWADRWLATRDLGALDPVSTYLFEIVFRQNRIVVSYDYEGLVLLAAFSGDGTEIGRTALGATAKALGCRLVEATEFEDLQALVVACEELDTRREGFVVRFASGLRLKFKGAAYRRIHAILSNVTPLGLWRALDAGDDLAALRREVPSEYLPDFDRILSLLDAQLSAIEARIEEEHARWAVRPDKELGLALHTLDPIAGRFIFGRRKRGRDWARDRGLRRTLLRLVRPDGNVLAGYEPSTLLLGAFAELG